MATNSGPIGGRADATTVEPESRLGCDELPALVEHAHHLRNNIKDYPRAIELYQKALACEPTAAIYMSLGGALGMDRQEQPAKKAYEQALALSPSPIVKYRSLAGLAGIAFRLSNYEQAIELATKSITTPGGENYATAFAVRAQAYEKIELPLNALVDRSQIVRIYPDSWQSYNFRGLVYLELGEYQAAIRDFEAAIALHGTRPEPRSHHETATRLFTEDLADECPDSKYDEVAARTTQEEQFVLVDCDLELNESHVITKQILIAGSRASGTEIRCNGATLDGSGRSGRDQEMIQIRSVQRPDGSFDRPEDVLVEGCRILGAIRVWGVARNGEGELLRESSYTAGHTLRTQQSAPSEVTLRDLEVTGLGHTPLYLGPGVTATLVENTKFLGRSSSVAMYLDAESFGNEIRNNEFHTKTDREVLAIDGSSNNTITGNWFSSLSRGGIYLYRNCGEGGTIRHQSPQRNIVLNNTFYYLKYRGKNPSVYLGSRNGNRGYCGKDSGYEFGSSISNLDFAKDNGVVENRIFLLDPDEMVRLGNPLTDTGNFTLDNETVADAPSRAASCVLVQEYAVAIVDHGTAVSHVDGIAGDWVCQDGRVVVRNLPPEAAFD